MPQTPSTPSKPAESLEKSHSSTNVQERYADAIKRGVTINPALLRSKSSFMPQNDVARVRKSASKKESGKVCRIYEFYCLFNILFTLNRINCCRGVKQTLLVTLVLK